jgi:prevent-host-death family protein
LIDQAAESHQPILIRGKRSSAVLVSADDWRAIQETLYLLSVPKLHESIKQELATPLAAAVEKLDWQSIQSLSVTEEFIDRQTDVFGNLA